MAIFVEEKLEKSRPKREAFLGVMSTVIPWDRLAPVISNVSGRKVSNLDIPLLKILFLQSWFNIPDACLLDVIADSVSMTKFVREDGNRDDLPRVGDIIVFREKLQVLNVSDILFKQVEDFLGNKGVVLEKGILMEPCLSFSDQLSRFAFSSQQVH